MKQPIRLIFFDVDGTLIDDRDGTTNVWSVLHHRAGVPESVRRRNYEEYLRGSLSYPDWVASDMQMWKASGLNRRAIVEEVRSLKLVPGAKKTIRGLASKGYRLALLSSSIDVAIEALFPNNPFEIASINRLHFDDDGQIASWTASRCGLDQKGRVLVDFARERLLSPDECAFIGDHSNDIGAAEVAGFSIAFNCRTHDLKAISDVCVDGNDLVQILPYF